MRDITIDFETRSAFDIRLGAWPYAEHETTEVMCLAVISSDGHRGCWLPSHFRRLLNSAPGLELDDAGWVQPLDYLLLSDEDLARTIAAAEEIDAANWQFEHAVWQYKMVPRGFKPIALEKWTDVAACGGYLGLPRKLGDMGKAVGMAEQKDSEGAKVMRRLCKPRKTKGDELDWHEDPADILTLCNYCVQDVVAEHALKEALPPLSEWEREVFEADKRINVRGVRIDVAGAESLVGLQGEEEAALLAEFERLTTDRPKLTSPRQSTELHQWFLNHGCPVANVQKDTMLGVLDNERYSEEVKAVARVRLALSRSSTAKLAKLSQRVNSDFRLRGSLMYCGPHTHRWSGRGIQPQNMPRDSFKPEQLDAVLADAASADYRKFRWRWGEISRVSSRAVRGLLIAEPGKVLTGCDLSNIEGRVLAWLAGDDHVLDVFRAYDAGTGPDPYRVIAGQAYGLPVDQITDDQRNAGKVAFLACGFNGGWKSYRQMAGSYGVEPPPDIVPHDEDWLDYDDSQMEEADAVWKAWANPLVQSWRENRPGTVSYWKSVGEAARNAVERGGAWSAGPPDRAVHFKVGEIAGTQFLMCRLPSGSTLYGAEPRIERRKAVWGDYIDTLTVMRVDQQTRKWRRSGTYGGRLVENITQSLARDVMAQGLVRLEDSGIAVVLHVHDEAVCEIDDDPAAREIAAERLVWAFTHDITFLPGCPISVGQPWFAHRFQKD